MQVFFGDGRFALKNVEADGVLMVVYGEIAFDARHRHRHIALDNRREAAADQLAVFDFDAGFHAQRKGHYVGEHHFFHALVAGNQGSLNRRAAGDGFVGIHRYVGNAAEELGDALADQRHTGGAADQNNAVDFVGAQLGVAQGALERAAQSRHQRLGGFVELALRYGDRHHAPANVYGDFRLHFAAEFALGGFQRLPQFAAVGQFGAFVVAQFLALAQKAVAQYLHEIFAAQMVVARAGGHLHHAVEIIEHGHVKGAAAQVVNQKTGVVRPLLQTIGQAGGGGFVQQAQRVQPGHLRRVARGLALDGVEIGGHGDDHIADGFAQKGFGVFFELL